jgi:hypothetical protein
MRHRKHQYLSSRLRRALRCCQRHAAAYLRQEGRLWLWFGSALLGVLAKSFFEALQASQPYRVSWPQIVMALVATLVTFQTTYERYKDVQASAPLLLQVSIAFGCGFFWQTVFNDLTDAK